MTDREFIQKCIELVKEYTNEKLEITDGTKITQEDIYLVWLTKVLQNNKALLSTNLFDGMYYEVTYNGNKKEFYLDAYKKFENKLYKEED